MVKGDLPVGLMSFLNNCGGDLFRLSATLTNSFFVFIAEGSLLQFFDDSV